MSNQDDNIQLPPVQASDDSSTQSIPVQTNSDDSQQIGTTPQPTAPTSPDPQLGSMQAGDVDLIEKQWVEKAKDIVQNTMGDPHSQSQKISQMKAAYIKQRYNKDVQSEDT